MKVEMYTGNEPYIFISYSHKDTDKVIPIIERLSKDSYRVWYDEGIPTTSRFNNVIAERIDRCEFMMLFISDNYIDSVYCNSELNFAEQEKKKLICIYENGVKLDPRFKMLKASLQGVEVSDVYDDNFFEKLYISENISVCLKTNISGFIKNEMIKFGDGDIYEGGVKDGKREGYGKMTYSNGDVYEGEWKCDGRDGKGMMIYANGEVYQGEFRNGTRHGKGKMMYKDNEVYEGEFRSGTRNGKGKMIYKDGKIYEGEFRSGTRNGYGVLFGKDGEIIYEGIWEKGKIKN